VNPALPVHRRSVDRAWVDKVDRVVDKVVDKVVGKMNCMGYNHCHSGGRDETFLYTYI